MEAQVNNLILIEYAALTDLTALTQLEMLCFTTDRLSVKQFKYFIQSPTAAVIIAKVDEQVVAAAVILFRKNSKLARLYSIAVHPEFQQRGIAQQLYHAIENETQKKGYQEIRLEVRKDNVSAIRFYEKNAYQAFGEYEQFYEDKADALRMKKTL